MTLLERIAQLTPPDARFCIVCHRHGCSTAPCPTRRAARARGDEGPRSVPYNQLPKDRIDWRDPGLLPHTPTTDFHQGRGR